MAGHCSGPSSRPPRAPVQSQLRHTVVHPNRFLRLDRFAPMESMRRVSSCSSSGSACLSLSRSHGSGCFSGSPLEVSNVSKKNVKKTYNINFPKRILILWWYLACMCPLLHPLQSSVADLRASSKQAPMLCGGVAVCASCLRDFRSIETSQAPLYGGGLKFGDCARGHLLPTAGLPCCGPFEPS